MNKRIRNKIIKEDLKVLNIKPDDIAVIKADPKHFTYTGMARGASRRNIYIQLFDLLTKFTKYTIMIPKNFMDLDIENDKGFEKIIRNIIRIYEEKTGKRFKLYESEEDVHSYEGMTKEEICDLVEYIQKNNSWENLYDTIQADRVVFKYYDLYTDTRNGKIWGINFREITHGHEVYGKSFFVRTSNTISFKEAVYKFLDTPVSEAKKEGFE